MIDLSSLFRSENQDPRALEFLLNSLEKNNLPGFDYLEFKKAIHALTGLSMEEATAYKSAFTTASTMGLTKEKLLESANYYRSVLEKEEAGFEKALEGQQETKIGSKKQEVERLLNQENRHAQEIRRLQEEAAAYRVQVELLNEQMDAEAQRLEKLKAGFHATLLSVLTQMDGDIEKLHRHV